MAHDNLQSLSLHMTWRFASCRFQPSMDPVCISGCIQYQLRQGHLAQGMCFELYSSANLVLSTWLLSNQLGLASLLPRPLAI